MKPLHIIPYLFLSSLVFSSCNKNGSGPSPIPPIVTKDTLSAGWTKTVIPAPNAGIVLLDVFFKDALTGYTMSDSICFKSTDGGITWTQLSPLFSHGINMDVTNDGKLFMAASNKLYRSADAGASFSITTGSVGTFYDISFIDNNNGFVISTNTLQQTADGGLTWPQVSPHTGLTINQNTYNTCLFLNATTGWVGMGNDIYRSSGNINNWTKSIFNGQAPTDSTLNLSAVSASVVYAACSAGTIYKSTDGGTSFSPIANLPKGPNGNSGYGTGGFPGLEFIDANTGYACFSNKIFKTTDGGNTWIQVVSLANSYFIEVNFFDAGHGWACTTKGEILRFAP